MAAMSETKTTAAKVITLDECQKHTTEDSCWLIIDGKVYDVTKFLDEHPGGYDIIITNTGKDATADFDEIGHSRAAKELLDKYEIGAYEGGPPENAKKLHKVALSKTTQQSSMAASLMKALLPLLVILAAILYNVYR